MLHSALFEAGEVGRTAEALRALATRIPRRNRPNPDLKRHTLERNGYGSIVSPRTLNAPLFRLCRLK